MDMLGLLASHAEWPAGKGALLPRGPSTCNLKSQHCTDCFPVCPFWGLGLMFLKFEVWDL